jgi:hypothetical protein
MKRIKMNLAVIAVLLGTGAAFASKAPRQDNIAWGKLSNGTYVVADANDTCTGASGLCKAVYPSGQDPNSDPSNPISTTAGAFHQNP